MGSDFFKQTPPLHIGTHGRSGVQISYGKYTTENDILNLIEEDEWMMNILRVAEKLNFPDWIIGAGFVRNKASVLLCGADALFLTVCKLFLEHSQRGGEP